MIRVDGLRVARGGRPVLHDLSVRVARGDWLCAIGPNGAGKSTLLATIAGLLPFEGEISIDGRPLRSMRRKERARRVAIVPQHPVIPEALRVADYVLLGRTPHLGLLAAEGPRDVGAVRDTLEGLDLWWAAGRRLDSLSGGELQRAVLARALAQRAPILLLDEPTTGLDLGNQQRVLELVESLRRSRGLTVVSAMHDLVLAGQFADRFVLLDGGRVAIDGSRAEVLDEDVIASHYGASVRVLSDGEGGVLVIPVRSNGATPGRDAGRRDRPSRSPGI